MNSVKLIAVFFLLASLMKATSWPLASSTFLQGTVTDQSAKQDSRYHGDAPEFGIKTERIRLPVSVRMAWPLPIPAGTVLPVQHSGHTITNIAFLSCATTGRLL